MIPTLEPLEPRAVPSATADTLHCYGAFLHRQPDAGELSGWLAYRAGGMTAGQEAACFAASEEFAALHPGSSDWLEAVYGALLGRSCDPTGRAAWGAMLSDHFHQTTKMVPEPFAGRLAVAQGVVGSQEWANLAESGEIHAGIMHDPALATPFGTVHAEGDLGLIVTPGLNPPAPAIPVSPADAPRDVQTISLPVQQLTAVTLDTGSVAVGVRLPQTALGTGLQPVLAWDGDARTVYLAVSGSAASTGGPSGIEVFASADGLTWAHRGTAAAWLPAGVTPMGLTLEAAGGRLTLGYVVGGLPWHATSVDLTWRSDNGAWVAASADGGRTWGADERV